MADISADYIDLMDEVYDGLVKIADSSRGIDHSQAGRAYAQEPAMFFDGAYAEVIEAGTIVEDKDLFEKAVYVGRELLKDFQQEGNSSDYDSLDYYLDKFIEMHRQAGITVD